MRRPYQDYHANDFAMDARFREWVLTKDESSDEFWKSFLTQFPEKKAAIEEARELVLAAGLSGDPEADKAYLEVWGHVAKHTVSTSESKSQKQSPVIRYGAIAAAAVIVASLIGILLPSGGFDTVEYHASYGQTKEVKLEDGSVITLNAGSSIEMSKEWLSQDKRAIKLTGEAFFHVMRTNDLKPFVVSTEDEVTVEVLGTEFNVDSRAGHVNVFLKSGKVRLHTKQGDVDMKPGEAALVDKGKSLVITRPEDTQLLVDWVSGIYTINDETVSAIATHIDRHFGLAVSIDEALKQKRITAKVPLNDLDVLLQVIKETLDVNVERNDDKVVIKQK